MGYIKSLDLLIRELDHFTTMEPFLKGLNQLLWDDLKPMLDSYLLEVIL